jgi:hypothetical protein
MHTCLVRGCLLAVKDLLGVRPKACEQVKIRGHALCNVLAALECTCDVRIRIQVLNTSIDLRSV